MNEVVVLASVSANPRQSTRQMAQKTGLSQSTVHRTLRKHKYRPFKTHKSQELRPGDAERRLEFAMSALEMIDEDPDFVRKIIFTNESSFTLQYAPNVQNTRYWTQENPYNVYSICFYLKTHRLKAISV